MNRANLGFRKQLPYFIFESEIFEVASSKIGGCGVDIICFNLGLEKQFTAFQTGS